MSSHQNRILYRIGSACMTIDALADELGLSNRQVSDAASGLIKRGYLERAEIGCFRLTEEGAEATVLGVSITSGPNGPVSKQRKPMRNTLRQRAWTAIRMQRKFTVPDLMIAATIGNESDPENNLQRYVSGLAKAGVVRKLRGNVPGTAISSPGFQRYALVQDLGDVAPTLRRAAIYDHNANREIANVDS